jgi:hypothetical protein
METDMIGRIPGRFAALLAVLLATGCVMALTSASAMAVITYTPIYNNIPMPLPGNVPSEAFEATSTSEFGGEVELAGPTLSSTKVTIAMSSWACQNGGGAEDGTCMSATGAKFEWPVTLHIYAAGPGDSVGTQIAKLTRTFKMPYRPSYNYVRCTGNGGWFRSGHCFHGQLFKINFLLKGVAIPSKAIVSVSFNTTNYGAEPTGVPGPYDSLNFGGMEGAPSVGSDPQPESDYTNSLWTGAYCDGGAAGTGTFRFDPALPTCVAPSDNFDNEGLQPGITIATG